MWISLTSRSSSEWISLTVHLFVPGTEYYWDNPSKVGSKVTVSDGSHYYRGPGTGTSSFITHSRLKSRNFIKGDDAFFLLSLEGLESFRHYTGPRCHHFISKIILSLKHRVCCLLVLRYFWSAGISASSPPCRPRWCQTDEGCRRRCSTGSC